MKNAIKTIHNKLGIKEFHFHALRHTHATILATHMSNPAIVQKRLGHSDIETTMKYYVFDVEHGDQNPVNVYGEFASFVYPLIKRRQEVDKWAFLSTQSA